MIFSKYWKEKKVDQRKCKKSYQKIWSTTNMSRTWKNVMNLKIDVGKKKKQKKKSFIKRKSLLNYFFHKWQPVGHPHLLPSNWLTDWLWFESLKKFLIRFDEKEKKRRKKEMMFCNWVDRVKKKKKKSKTKKWISSSVSVWFPHTKDF